MNFLHYQVDTGPEHVIQVKLTGSAEVRLLDTMNFAKYKLGKSYAATAGPETTEIVKFVPPYKGKWHIVVDVGGRGGGVRALVDIVKA
jgi:hypothetical protein